MDWIKQTRTYATSITLTLDTPTTHRGSSMPRRRTKNGGARGASGAFVFDGCIMIGRVADADEIVMMMHSFPLDAQLHHPPSIYQDRLRSTRPHRTRI